MSISLETLALAKKYTDTHSGGGGGGSGGTDNYLLLKNRPKINGVTLDGNKTSKDLKLLGDTEIKVSTTNGNILVRDTEISVYKLPKAGNELGGVKIGEGIEQAPDGTISVKSPELTWDNIKNKPTTLAGYGITDVRISGNTITIGNKTLSPVVDDSYVHTDNNFTNELKAKLEKISEEPQVQSDWNEKTQTSLAFIKNKPTKLSQFTNDSGFINKDVNNLTNYYKKEETYTRREVDDLITAGGSAEVVKVQSDWNVNDEFALTFIKNKPTKLSQFDNDSNFIKNDVNNLVNYYKKEETYNKQEIDELVKTNGAQADWNETNDQLPSFIKNKPTGLSQFTNDTNFIDNTVSNLLNYYNKTEIDDLIKDFVKTGLEIKVVESLPETGESNILYLVKKTKKLSSNLYDEYIWIQESASFELIGDTSVNLKDYLKVNGDASNVTNTFTEAQTRENIISGEKLSISLGKIAKMYTDLKNVAFTGNYTDLSNIPMDAISKTQPDNQIEGNLWFKTLE